MNTANRRTTTIVPVRLSVRALGLIAAVILAGAPVTGAEAAAAESEVASVLEAHDEYLYMIAFSPDQRDVLVGGEDGKLSVIAAVANE